VRRGSTRLDRLEEFFIAGLIVAEKWTVLDGEAVPPEGKMTGDGFIVLVSGWSLTA